MNVAHYRKAIAAVLVPIVVYYAARHGLDLNADQVAALTTLVTGAVVYAVPNASPAPDLRHPAGRDRGTLDVTSVLVCVVLVVLIVFLVNRI